MMFEGLCQISVASATLESYNMNSVELPVQ